jgi:hypothetical protein
VNDGYTILAIGLDATGVPWEVGVNVGGLVIKLVGATIVLHGSDGIDSVRPADLILSGKPLEQFAEAVARAVTPGQQPSAPKAYYACCIHCEHDGESDPGLDDERHPNPCPDGCHAVTPRQVIS